MSLASEWLVAVAAAGPIGTAMLLAMAKTAIPLPSREYYRCNEFMYIGHVWWPGQDE